MTTDITELAQREKFEAWAEECNALPWGYLKKRRIYTGFYSEHTYTSLWAAWKAAGAELVEALEKAQAKATQQGNIACALLDEVTQLRSHADEKAPELRAQLIEADSELEALRQRIAELESFHTAYMAWSDKTDWVRTDRRFDVVKPLGKHLADVLKAYIEHLESRTVKLPKKNIGWDRDEDDCWNNAIDACAEALTAAGIKWEAE